MCTLCVAILVRKNIVIYPSAASCAHSGTHVRDLAPKLSLPISDAPSNLHNLPKMSCKQNGSILVFLLRLRAVSDSIWSSPLGRTRRRLNGLKTLVNIMLPHDHLQDRPKTAKARKRMVTACRSTLVSTAPQQTKKKSLCTPVRYSYPDTSHKGKTSK